MKFTASDFRFVPVPEGVQRKGYGHSFVIDRKTGEKLGSLRPMFGGGYTLYDLEGSYLDFCTLSREPSARKLQRLVEEQ